VDEGSTLSFTVSSSDCDGDDLIYCIKLSCPFYTEIGDRCILSAHSRGSLTTRDAKQKKVKSGSPNSDVEGDAWIYIFIKRSSICSFRCHYNNYLCACIITRDRVIIPIFYEKFCRIFLSISFLHLERLLKIL